MKKTKISIMIFSFFFLTFGLIRGVGLKDSLAQQPSEEVQSDNLEQMIKEIEDSNHIVFTSQERACLIKIARERRELFSFLERGEEREAFLKLKELINDYNNWCGNYSFQLSLNYFKKNQEAMDIFGNYDKVLSFYFKNYIKGVFFTGANSGLSNLENYKRLFYLFGTDKESVDFKILLMGDTNFDEKAKALNLGQLAYDVLVYNNDFVDENIISTYPLSAKVEKNLNFREELAKILESSFALHELMWVDYALANYYLDEALINKDNPTLYNSNYDKFKRYLSNGNYHYYEHEYVLNGKNYGKGIKNYYDQGMVSAEARILFEMPKLLVYDKINGLKLEADYSMSNDEIENNFKEILSISQSDPFVSKLAYRYEHFIRFYYAIFLNNAYGQSRAEDIRKLLDPIYQMKGNSERGIFVFLQKEKAYPDNYPHKQEILKLTQVDPRMRDMLISAGWKIEK